MSIKPNPNAFMTSCSLLLLAAAHHDQTSHTVPQVKEEDMDIKVEIKSEQAVSPGSSNPDALPPEPTPPRAAGNPALPRLELSAEIQQLILLSPSKCPMPIPSDRLCPPRNFQLRSWGVPIYRLPGAGDFAPFFCYSIDFSPVSVADAISLSRRIPFL